MGNPKSAQGINRALLATSAALLTLSLTAEFVIAPRCVEAPFGYFFLQIQAASSSAFGSAMLRCDGDLDALHHFLNWDYVAIGAYLTLFGLLVVLACRVSKSVLKQTGFTNLFGRLAIGTHGILLVPVGLAVAFDVAENVILRHLVLVEGGHLAYSRDSMAIVVVGYGKLFCFWVLCVPTALASAFLLRRTGRADLKE